MKKHKTCFTPNECCTDYCPNIQYDTVDQTWGYGIADDCGLEKIKCRDCRYMTYECEDCLFNYYNENCPESKDISQVNTSCIKSGYVIPEKGVDFYE